MPMREPRSTSRAGLVVGLRVTRCALTALTLALSASTASANGRFPRAQRLIQDTANPDLMALYGTYGLLVTRDAGASFRHVCEAATGPYVGEDSLLEIMPGERVVLRTDTGLSRSDPSLCSYDTVFGSPDAALQDITRDSLDPNGLLALSTTLGEDGAFATRLSSSTDGGATFTPLAAVSPQVIELGLTLDVAAGDPQLIYLSGFDAQGRGTLAKSTDRGQSFTGFTITGLGVATPPYIAALSALDPDRVFVRTDVFTLPNDDFEARETADDSLYFTPDGGQTWHRALNKRGKLYGFALSPDERWVLAGYGDPVLPAIFVEPDELGLYRVELEDLLASPDAPPWERIYDRGVTCLRWTEQALFACLAQDDSGFELGRAPDASFSLADPAPFTALLRLPDVLPLECPPETPGAACLLEPITGWPATCQVLRAQCSLDGGGGSSGASGAPGAAGTAGDTPSSMEPGASGTGGASPAGSVDGAGGAGADADNSAPPSADGRSRSASGSCSLGARGGGVHGGIVRGCAALAFALLVAARRWPRRRRALRLALLAIVTLHLTACSDAAGPDDARSPAGDPGERDAASEAPVTDCGGAGEDFLLGMSKTSPSGALTVTLDAADPAPPLVGTNSWILQLSDDSGAPITAASVSLTGWMPEHGHGLSSVPLIGELEDGRYQIRPIQLFMPQLWEFDVGITWNAEREIVTFRFCVR